MAKYETAVTRFALASLFAAALCAQQTPAPCLDRPEADRPYSRERLLNVVRDQTPARAAYLIRTCGIRTPWSEELNQALREAGAEDSVVLAVREKAPEPPPPKPIPAGPKVGDVKVNPKDGLRYAWVPPGTFRMGCSDGDTECFDREKPAHAAGGEAAPEIFSSPTWGLPLPNGRGPVAHLIVATTKTGARPLGSGKPRQASASSRRTFPRPGHYLVCRTRPRI